MSYPVCYPVALRLGRVVNNQAKGGVNNRRGSGLAVGSTLKCERTGFWAGLQIAPQLAVGARCVPFSRVLRAVFAQFCVWVVLSGSCG